jgi:hypothetical protein
MKKQTKPIRTKRAMWHFAVKLRPADRQLWVEAAGRLGESLSETLRLALREYCKKVIAGSNQNAA